MQREYFYEEVTAFHFDIHRSHGVDSQIGRFSQNADVRFFQSVSGQHLQVIKIIFFIILVGSVQHIRTRRFDAGKEGHTQSDDGQ